MAAEFDNSTHQKVTDIANALEEAGLALSEFKPLDISKVTIAVGKFATRQEQANAVCSAVKQINPEHIKADITIPPLEIKAEKIGSNWASLRVYTTLGDGDQKFMEPLYVFPLTQPELTNIKCEMTKPPEQVGELPHPSQTPK